jgi:Holliday junction resolvase RusA-like endonuclease
MSEVTFSLPYPPSANRLWRAVKGRNIKTAAYRAWMTEALWAINLARPGRIAGAYHLRIYATPPDRRARDIDNLTKALSDAIAKGGVVDNDSKARSVKAEWEGEPAKGGAIRIVVWSA